MPSHIASVCFTVHIDGTWHPCHDEPLDHHDPAALARHHLRRIVAEVLSQHSVLDLAAAQDAANTALSRWLHPEADLEITGSVRLTVAAHDRDLAKEHSRRQQASELEHEDELRRLTHLQRVLADPDLRRVWWLDQFPDRYNQLPDLIGELRGLPAPRQPGDDGIRSDLKHFTDQFLTALHTPQQRELFLNVLSQTLHILGQHNLKSTAAQWQMTNKPGSTPA